MNPYKRFVWWSLQSKTRLTLAFAAQLGSVIVLLFYFLFHWDHFGHFLMFSILMAPIILLGSWWFAFMFLHVAQPYLQEIKEKEPTRADESTEDRTPAEESRSAMEASAEDRVSISLSGISWYDRLLGVRAVLFGTVSRTLRTVYLSVVLAALVVIAVAPVRTAVLSTVAQDLPMLFVYCFSAVTGFWLLLMACVAAVMGPSRLTIHFSSEGIRWIEDDRKRGNVVWSDVGFTSETRGHIRIMGKRRMLFVPIPKRLVVPSGALIELRSLLVKMRTDESTIRLSQSR